MSALESLWTETPRPQLVREHRHAGWLAVVTVCFGAFMGQLDASIVTLTFPALQRRFGAGLAAVQWVSLAYLLVLVALVVAAGRLADAAGRKLVYLQGFVVFTVASAACGLAPSLGALVAFRIVQAVGAAMLQANSVALVVTSVPRDRMRAALGVQAAAQALGLALGPTAGALLVATVGWRWVFLVNVPVGIAAVIAGRFLLPRTRQRTTATSFDWPGLALLAACTITSLLAISGASGLAMPAAAAGVLALAAVCSAAGFTVRIRRARHPLVEPSLLARPPVAIGLCGALCGYLVLFAPLALFPQIYAGRGMTAGLVLTALPAGFAATALVGDRLLPRRWGGRARATSAGLLCAAAACGLGLGSGSPVLSAVLLAVLGTGLGVFIPANNASVMGTVPAGRSGMGGGLVNMSRGLGTALGVATVTLCLHLTGWAGGRSGGGAGGVLDGPRLALAVVAAASVLAAATGYAGRSTCRPGPRAGQGTGE
jgi:MFS family permease